MSKIKEEVDDNAIGDELDLPPNESRQSIGEPDIVREPKVDVVLANMKYEKEEVFVEVGIESSSSVLDKTDTKQWPRASQNLAANYHNMPSTSYFGTHEAAPLLAMMGQNPFIAGVIPNWSQVSNTLLQNNQLQTPSSNQNVFCECSNRGLSNEDEATAESGLYSHVKNGKCVHCTEKFYQAQAAIVKNQLKTHLLMNAGLFTENPVQCRHCGKKFDKKEDLEEHIKIHIADKPYECDYCSKKFKNKGDLQKHFTIHTGEKPFVCDYCSKKFRHKGDLQRHLMIHTGEKPFECSKCGKKFNHKGALHRHFMIHTGEKPYECGHCNRKFRQKGDMQNHLMVHTGEKPFECSHCRKRFSQNRALVTHIRVHTGEKPYECKHCHRCFSETISLQRHLLIHTGEKPYECCYCNKNFRHKENLQVHFRIHTGEKPYECNHCNKRFSEQGNFRKHLKVHEAEKSLNGVEESST